MTTLSDKNYDAAILIARTVLNKHVMPQDKHFDEAVASAVKLYTYVDAFKLRRELETLYNVFIPDQTSHTNFPIRSSDAKVANSTKAGMAELLFPTLVRSARNREYKSYASQERAEVVYEYLFGSPSHRWLDINILKQGDLDTRGWHSMGILHYFGLVNSHKAFFKNYSVRETIDYLENRHNLDYADIIKHLRVCVPSNS